VSIFGFEQDRAMFFWLYNARRRNAKNVFEIEKS
jgi:hypothetical protein